MKNIPSPFSDGPAEKNDSTFSLPRSLSYAIEYWSKEAGMSPSEWVAQCIKDAARMHADDEQKKKDVWDRSDAAEIGYIKMIVGTVRMDERGNVVAEVDKGIEEKIAENRRRLEQLTESLLESGIILLEDGTEHQLGTGQLTRTDIEGLKQLIADDTALTVHMEEMSPAFIRQMRELERRRIV